MKHSVFALLAVAFLLASPRPSPFRPRLIYPPIDQNNAVQPHGENIRYPSEASAPSVRSLVTLGALVDGFFVPEVGASSFHTSQATADAGLALFRFCSIAIQLFAKSSVIAISMAILLWSFSFVRAGRASLLAGFIGVAAVLSQACILVLGGSVITAHTIVFVAAPQMLWYIGVGLLLVSGEL